MTSINKHFHASLTSLCRLLFCFFVVLQMQPAWAADPIFTVQNVKVDATAGNAIAAREKAFQKAQVKAFQNLAARMLPDSEVATYQVPDMQVISTMIQDYEITEEKLSSVRYVGTYTFRFRDKKVRAYFAQQGETYSDISSKPLLVLPFLKVGTETGAGADSKGAQTILWSAQNEWMQAWQRVPSLQGVVPLEVPIGDISDVRDIRDDEALSYDPERLNALLQRYGANAAVVAIASPDQDFVSVTQPDQAARGALKIDVYKTDSGYPELLQRVSAIADGVMTRSELYDRAVVLVRNALKTDWKNKTAVSTNAPSVWGGMQGGATNTAGVAVMQVVVPLNDLSDWTRTQRELKLVSALSRVTLKSISPTQANVEIAYRGDDRRLAVALSQVDMAISEEMIDGSVINVLKAIEPAKKYEPTRF